MQGRLILTMTMMSALVPAEAMAADAGRRQGCRLEQQQPRQKQVKNEQQQQQRARHPDCREKRSIPPVVDPTPIYLL